MTKKITRRTAFAVPAAVLATTASADQSSEIERLFAELATLKRAMPEMDDDTFTEAQEDEDRILDAITAQPARTPREICRKLQAWALVTCVNPQECREGPSPELPMPLACEAFASLLEDTQCMGTIPLHGLIYPRRNAPGWKERDKRRA